MSVLHNPKFRQMRGFTLVELGIVIAVISVLSTSVVMAGGFLRSSETTTTSQKISQIHAAVKYYLRNKSKIETTAGNWGSLNSLTTLEGQPLGHEAGRRNRLSQAGFLQQAMPYTQNNMLFEGVFILETFSSGHKGLMIKIRAEDESKREQIHQDIVQLFSEHENFYPELLSVGAYRCARSNDSGRNYEGNFLRLCFKY